ncbi:hypothetical protein [Herbiconiux daphne]|uniref:Uncharacterized protein n=1 Tax=Herbiconiux daphne TaxID=2970914 RepID=A0ABT2H8S0_9MICO|nr:hypothetical protein [Herbiconiux daphne]MCS5736283.1 hypothetical protein [Herbiconiux daphne]
MVIGPIAFLIWLLLRGMYLWLLVPICAALGVTVHPILKTRRATIGLRGFKHRVRIFGNLETDEDECLSEKFRRR